MAFRNVGAAVFSHNDRLYLQFRKGRLAGWKVTGATTGCGNNGPVISRANNALKFSRTTNLDKCNSQQMDDPWEKISN